MRTPLDKTLRGKLEKTVEKARDIVEVAVTEALTRLGIGEGNAPNYLSDAERKLRTRLRAHGRQLGDVLNRDTGKQETELLVNEMAYEHWHRMLFARFLEQSDLLMYDQYTQVTLKECFELAEEEPDIKDGWELAGQLAQEMLPQIFRADSPVFDVKLSINHVQALEELIANLHPDTFQASDALGWCYQFWQNKKKKQVNESGVKIGAKELSPVTQLFTEPYMVSFLLDNALGAWWAKRRLTQDDLATASSEQELRDLASIPGVPLEYLRFVQDEKSKVWRCAAGDFDKWPDNLSEFKALDPCCGSGHFLVAKFLMLVPMRMELEKLTAKEAIDKVLAQNIHGLELDQRCVELAAFALALEAWRYPNSGGYRQLPELQVACSGLSISEAQKEWKDVAKDNDELKSAINWMQETFKNAPSLGSLIKPKPTSENESTQPWSLLQAAVTNHTKVSNDAKATANGLIKAAEVLTKAYDLISTNPPYKTKGELCQFLQDFIEKYYKKEKSALETVFISRCLKFSKSNGVVSLVLPQNWLFLTSYTDFRNQLLNQVSIDVLAWLGDKSFETPIGVSPILISLANSSNNDGKLAAFDVSPEQVIDSKKNSLKQNVIKLLSQSEQVGNPDSRIMYEPVDSSSPLSDDAFCYQGLRTGDKDQFVRKTWEVDINATCWDYLRTPNAKSDTWGGMFDVIYWEQGHGKLAKYARENRHKLHDMHESGNLAWDSKGIIINEQGLNTSAYCGSKFDASVSVIFPKNENDLDALLAYCGSNTYITNVRKLDKKRSVTNATLLKVPFDKKHWNEQAKVLNDSILSQPFSSDSTQWIFHGHPCASVIWDEETKTTAINELRVDETVLQIAVARLLGYRWPAELDTEIELAPEMREVIAQNNVFDGLIDDDGIVCIPAIRGEKPAVDRLEAILHAAYGDKWSATVLNNLLKSVKSRDLNIWLRDKFFEQHSKLFQHRPFIWQIWDGLPDGFSALVNYHMLDYKGLERLIYTYLDDWISTQIQLEKDGDEGAEIRLAAARNLRKQLESILVGEEGLDIFVRWKPLAEQPIGWNPDLNDGVRLNIRPFMKTKDVGKKDAGILRSKPNIHWKKDRGTDVASAPWYDLGLEYGGKQGDRINDHHLTLAEKKAAKEAKND